MFPACHTRDAAHFVHFYEDDALLLDSLSGFIGGGLRMGDTCIVVATEPHREGLDARLRACGLDLASARGQQQYVSLDAAETLSRFMKDGWPDPRFFNEVVGGLLARATRGGRRVRVFGEMVALLWAEGQGEAMLRLEELWNDLGREHTFSLFCAYPSRRFTVEEHASPFAQICSLHSHVVASENYAKFKQQLQI